MGLNVKLPYYSRQNKTKQKTHQESNGVVLHCFLLWNEVKRKDVAEKTMMEDAFYLSDR